MTSLNHTIRRARWRGMLNRMLHCAGIGAAAGAAAAVIVLTIDRLALGGTGLAWPVHAALAAAGLALGAAWPWLKAPDLRQIALQLDRTLHLKDRIATAHAIGLSPVHTAGPILRGARHDESFAELVRRDGDQLAGRIDVRSVVPIRVTGAWAVTAAIALVWFVAFMFLPSVTGAAEPPQSPQQQQAAAELQEQREQEREQLKTTIDEAVAEVMQEADGEIDERTQRELEALDRLARQLEEGVADEAEMDQMREESAARLNELSSLMAERARQEQLANEKLAERFRGLETPEDRPMSAEEFDEALRRGDFGRAADSLEELLQRRDSMSPQERSELAEHLQEMTDQLDRAQQRDQQDLTERAAQLEQALRDQGMDEDAINDLLENLPQSEADTADELAGQNMDEEMARRLARELQRLREQREVNEQVERDSQDINQTLRDIADELDRAEDQPSPPQQEQQEQQQEQDRQQSDADETDPAQQQQRDTQRDDQDTSEQSSQERDQGQQTGDDTSEQQQSEQAREQQGQQEEQVDESQQGQAQQQQGEDASSPDAQQQAAREQQDVAEQDPDAAPDAPGQGDEQAAEEDAIEGVGGDAEQGDDLDSAGEGQSQADQQQESSPGDALRRMQQRRDSAQDRQESSQRMREQARRMAQSQQDQPASSEPQQSGDGAGDGSPPRRDDGEAAPPLEATTEDLDLRQDMDAEQGELIAEWLSDEPREGQPRTSRSDVDRRVRQAQEIAERAVDESAVPSRYHRLIRRYFGRLDETIDRASSNATEDSGAP